MNNIFNSTNKKTENGFIDKNEILKYVSEEDIYELVFGFKPKEFDYVVSPFRPDRRPGCWFQYSASGKLSFIDFGSQIYIKSTRMVRIDCFDAVKYHFNLKNLYQTLLFIKKHLIDGKSLPEREVIKFNKRPDRPEVEISFIPRNFIMADKAFWYDRYGISKENLIEDKVFPVTQYQVKGSKVGDYTVNTNTLTYCYAEFPNGRKKIYRPYNSKRRFLTNCISNDIGGLSSLSTSGKKLVITKSYKDYRILKNFGLDVIWFQNEGMFPSLDILLPLCQKFQNVYIFFDNDNQGKEASEKLQNVINSYIPGKASCVYLPEAPGFKDPGEFIEHKGRKQLLDFLIEKRLV